MQHHNTPPPLHHPIPPLTSSSPSAVVVNRFSFRTSSAIDGPVESWMTAAEDEMHVSLRDITKEGVFLYAQGRRTDWLKLVLGMVGLVGSQIWYHAIYHPRCISLLTRHTSLLCCCCRWTWEVEDSFNLVAAGNKYAMKDLEQRLTGQLNDLVVMVRDKLDSITRKKASNEGISSTKTPHCSPLTLLLPPCCCCCR